MEEHIGNKGLRVRIFITFILSMIFLVSTVNIFTALYFWRPENGISKWVAGGAFAFLASLSLLLFALLILKKEAKSFRELVRIFL